ncbi:MAG: S8 family serine peptidase, partial [Phycisphaerae bacterium]
MPAKPAATIVKPGWHDPTFVVVKFQDGLRIRAQQGALTDFGLGTLAPAANVLASIPGARWKPSHSAPEAKLDEWRDKAEQNLGRQVADLNLQFNLELPAGADASAVCDQLNALAIVELAKPIELPPPPPVPGSFVDEQVYLDPATAGIGAEPVWVMPGGTGAGVRICDIEYSWNLNHQDLPAVTLLGPASEDPFNDNDHGTAVLGELVSQPNGFGTTGICAASTMFIAGARTGGVYDVGAAITNALTTLVNGDVILIEQQIRGPNWIDDTTQFGLVPVEWDSNYYNAIVLAVGVGVIVVEAAGNGSQNLDGAEYNVGHAPFLLANDSGAIIVGAGARPGGSTTDRSRLGFSNFGATVDLQGWGEGVTTTGYGFRYNAEGVDLLYTGSFSGTSSASPIVTGACVLTRSIYRAATGTWLTPAQVRSALIATGSPQQSGANPASENIGPRPNIQAALNNLLGNRPPDARCRNRSIPVNANCCATVTAADIDNGSSDPDPGQPVTICITAVDGVPQNCVDSVFLCGTGARTFTLSVTDPLGITSTCNAQVTLIDTTPPSITCPPGLTIECDEPRDPSNTGSATATDNCGVSGIVFNDVITNQICTHTFTINRTWTASDAAGNTASCLQLIQVVDTTPPVITCPPDIRVPFGNKICDSAVQDWLDSTTATDNCDPDVAIVND